MLNGSYYLKETGNMKSISLFKYAGYAAIMSLTLSCVTDEQFESQIQSDSNLIGFSISSAISSDGSSLTKARHYADNALMMTGKSEEDTLYIHASSENNLSTVSSQVETRGIPVSSSNFAQVCKNFSVTGYLPDGRLYMNDVLVNNLSNGVWSPDQNHFWPENDIMMDFFAYAPATVDKNPLFTADDIQFITSDGKSLSFNYTVPGAGQEVTNAAEQQHDIMFAYKACSKSMTNQSGSVPLKFYHAFAGVKFVAKDIAAGTVKSITLKNLYGSGSCTYVFNENGEPSITWTFNGEQQTSAFHQEFNVKVENQQTGEQQITDKNHETTFMMLPQEIENAEVEVLFNDGEKEYTLVGKLYDPSITTTDNDTDLSTWDAGKIYTYAITTESINWTYVFEVTPSIDMTLGQTSAQYNVSSYRYRTQFGDTPDNRENIPWTAEGVSANETNREDGTTSDVNINEILTNFTYNGDGGHDSGYALEITRNLMHTTWNGDNELKNTTPKGTSEAPYDLSTSGGTLSRETANCYCVNAPGTYQLPLVYGNAIKNGSPNTSAYNSDFSDYLGNSIDNPYIYNNHGYRPYDACLVWSDGFYMFENIHLNKDKTMLIFTLNKEYMQQANAIVAVRDAGGTIMWSWHIWVTEHDVYNENVYGLQDWVDGTLNAYQLMGWNLGWVDGKMVYYNQRDLSYTFTQDVSGRTAKLNVTQKGDRLDYKDVGSTYYQWGRKDPIVALRNRNAVGRDDYRPQETIEDKYKYDLRTGPTTISESIRNPNIYYTRSSSNAWLNTSDFTTYLWDTSSPANADVKTSTKTIYDPSPRGYKIPPSRAFLVFVNGETGQGSQEDKQLNGDMINDYQYDVWTQRDKRGTKLTLTSTGQRADRDKQLEVVTDGPKDAEIGGLWAMDGVYYMTCKVSGDPKASYVLCIRKPASVFTTRFGGAQTMARPVRCIKE